MSGRSEPEANRVPAWLHDGQSAVRHEVVVGIEGDCLAISGFAPVALALLRRRDASAISFRRTDIAGWCLGFDSPPPPELLASLPAAARYGGLIDRIGLGWGALALAGLSAVVLLGAIHGLDLVARAVPFSWEQRLGDAINGDFGEYACRTPDGQRALDGLARRLSSEGRPMRVSVLDIPVVNAVALPGGRILIFRGLIDKAKSSDEVAGVLAHEIGHVERRHVMVALLRRFGIGLLVGSGGKTAEYGQALLESRYSRAAESEADDYSIAQLTAARISPAATAALFARLGREEAGTPGIFVYLASHPPSAERQRRFAAAARRLTRPAPALDAPQWAAVRAICAGHKRDPGSEFRLGL